MGDVDMTLSDFDQRCTLLELVPHNILFTQTIWDLEFKDGGKLCQVYWPDSKDDLRQNLATYSDILWWQLNQGPIMDGGQSTGNLV
jgi:hypothetical protein